MKKLSFFLMAMLFSVMSFAAETLLFTQTYPGNPSKYTNAYTSSFTVTTGDYVLTYANINNGQQSNNWTAVRAGSKSTASVATITSEQIAKPISKVTINFTQVNGTSTNELYLEVSASSDFATVTKVNADIAVGTVEFTLTTPAANQYYRIVIDQAKASANGFNRFDAVSFYEGEAASEEPVEIVNAPIFSTSTANFTEAFTLNITSDEGTTLKYTLDNTDPTTSETAIEVATNTASVEITKSTAVKAIAIKGELVSATKSKVYCYVNSPETAYTVAEAIAVIDAGLGLENELYVKGEISEVESFNETYGSITYWIQDEEGNKFECYSGLGLNKAKFTSIDDLVVGSKVVVCGVMKLYTSSSGDKIYEFNYNNYIVSLELPVTTYDVTVAEATVSTVGQNIVLSGSWEEKALTVMLWQGGATQGFGTYAVEDYSPITLGTTELTATSEGVYADNGDGTFAFTATATDADGAIYNISVTGAIPATVEPETVEIEATAEFADNGEGSLYIDVCEENWAWCVQLTVWDCDGSAGEYEISGLYSTDNDYNVSGTATIAYDEYAETDVLTATLKTADESLTVLVTLYKKAGSTSVEGTPMELNVTDLVVVYEPLAFTGTAEFFTISLVPNTEKPIEGKDMTFELDLDKSSIQMNMGLRPTPLTLISGEITVDMGAPAANATVTASIEDQTYLLTINMTAATGEAIELYLDATSVVVDEDLEVLTLYSTYTDEEGTTFPVAIELQSFENVAYKEYAAEEICKITIGDMESENEEDFLDIAFASEVVVVIGEEGENSISLEGEFSSWNTGATYEVSILGTLPVAKEEAPLKGVVKRAVQLGESVVVLTHEEDGTAHIYNVVGENITEVSLEGVVPVDPENKGSYLAISDIAVTADGKLVANNYVRCQFAESDVETGYKRGTLTFYIWNDLAGAPVVWFQSMASSNSLKSDQGYTMAVVGTSTNADILVTGVHNTQRGVRMSHFSVVDGVFEDTQDGGKKEPYYYYIGSNFKGASAGADAAVFNEQTQGVNLQFLASPLVEENWIIDGELVDPIEFTNPQTHGGEVVKGATLTTDLGKKFNGATVLKDGEQVLMVAPYADADGKLAGVKVLDITDGLAADSVVATLDLDAPVEATAAATAVAVAAYDVNITLVADGYIYNLVYELPKPERTEETVLNPFAYDLSSTLSEDLATLTINYTLNANADAVEVVILSGEEVVKTIPCKGINKGTYTVEVSTAGLPQEGDLTWAVNVKGTSVAAPTQNPTIYSFYHPSAVDIDNNPENATFGMLLVNEAMQSVASKTEGYVSAGFGAGIFAFNPAFELITNGDKPGFNGGKTFSTETNMFAPRRIRISEDGRIFATAQDGSGEYLWEINPENLNEWTTVFQGTNDGYTLKDADGNFIAGTNSGFDVRGEGENLQLLMLSSSLPGAQVASFMCHTYDLGTATTWATAPTKEVPGANYMMVTNQSNAQFDKDGGVWYISYRGETTDAYPGLVHINKDGVEDLKVLRNYARNAGFRFNDDFTKVIIAGTTDGAANPKKATVYAVSADENGVPVLTEELVIDMATVGNNLNDFAWDYAGNLFACGNSSEKLVAWAMPYDGEVTTPAASKYAFTLAPEPVYAVVEDEITNLTSDVESLTLIGGPSTNYQVEVYLELGEENPTNATFALTENSSISVMGQDATFIEGYVAEVDIFTPAAKAVIKAEFGGQYYEFHLTMTGTPAEALEIVITDANVMVEEYEDFPGAPTKSYALTMTADWTNPADQVTYPVKVELPVYDPNVAEQLDAIATVFVGDMASENFLGFVDGAYLTVTTVEGVVTATGAISNPGTGFAANLTISGKLPQDPETGLDNINLNAQPVKMIKNGMLIIIKNGVEYNVQGAVVK